MAIVAVTHIRHGEDGGSVKEFGIGDNVTGLSEDQLRGLVLSGAAIETGKDRKFTSPDSPPEGADDETRKRDKLLAQGIVDGNESPAVVTAVGAVDTSETESSESKKK